MKKNSIIKGFFERYHSDKKYKALVQLIGYSAFILILVVGLNFSSTGSNSSSARRERLDDKSNIHEKKEDMVDLVGDNYSYDVHVSFASGDTLTDVFYSGKVYSNRMEILKKVLEDEVRYYKKDSRYYYQVGDKLELGDEALIYDVVEKELVEYHFLLENLLLASLDHVTEYSNGKREYVYHLKVKDIVLSYPEVDEIEISVVEENGEVRIEADYLVLLKAMGKDVDKCVVSYVYRDIGSVLEFDIGA